MTTILKELYHDRAQMVFVKLESEMMMRRREIDHLRLGFLCIINGVGLLAMVFKLTEVHCQVGLMMARLGAIFSSLINVMHFFICFWIFRLLWLLAIHLSPLLGLFCKHGFWIGAMFLYSYHSWLKIMEDLSFFYLRELYY